MAADAHLPIGEIINWGLAGIVVDSGRGWVGRVSSLLYSAC